ncbi:MAG: bifunctional folylpolyglutamate synthase/dihydrofolate synthase, partial [Paraprevotella sp.]|nr:bifunctional folylpolyglutamate synthase/dihydrofolate synthase [Paraprevotella sp.]
MTYKEATEYMFNSLPMFQNIGGSAYKEGLYNTRILDEHEGHPHRRYKTIHVGGTNGKGSCSHTLAAILQEAGYKVGLYTSPHLLDFRERIRVNGQMIPEEMVTSFVENERSFFEPLHPSFFELTTALAFKYFTDSEVDVAVIEVGLGGRLDCTNIITPDLSVITNISLDHVQYLGNTLTAIAGEKAGIIKPGIPVVIGETTAETREVFRIQAEKMHSPIRFAEEEHEIISSVTEKGCRLYRTRHWGELTGELTGLCQEKNTATILSAVDELQKTGYAIQTTDVRNGFMRVCELTGLKGRWQQVGSHPTVICDTGHNVGGIHYIAEQLRYASAENIHIVIGMVNDKDIQGVLDLLPKNAIYYFTKASVKRALDEKELQKHAMQSGLQGSAWPDVASAYRAARQAATAKDLIFVGGSTFIVSDFFAFLTSI